MFLSHLAENKSSLCKNWYLDQWYCMQSQVNRELVRMTNFWYLMQPANSEILIIAHNSPRLHTLAMKSNTTHKWQLVNNRKEAMDSHRGKFIHVPWIEDDHVWRPAAHHGLLSCVDSKHWGSDLRHGSSVGRWGPTNIWHQWGVSWGVRGFDDVVWCH